MIDKDAACAAAGYKRFSPDLVFGDLGVKFLTEGTRNA